MKACIAFILLSYLINISNCTAPFNVEVKAFRNYKKQYAKNYKTPNEDLKALQRFIKAFRKVNEYNALFGIGLVDFALSLNKFADLPEEQIEMLYTGNVIPETDFTDFTIRPKAVITVTPDMYPPGPASIDWRSKGHVTPVKDQGYVCNSCWAFSAVAALESAFSIKFGISSQLSEQYLVDCNRNDMTGNWGCNGGSLASAYMNIQYAPGIPSDSDYPYQEFEKHDGLYPCRYNRTTSVGTTTGYGRIKPNDEVTLKNVVAANGPVAFALNGAQETFLYYSTGIYNDAGCRPGVGHSALIYGYGSVKLKNGTMVDFWLCKNSWSTDWGDKGYFKMIRGRNMCGLTSYLIFPLV